MEKPVESMTPLEAYFEISQEIQGDEYMTVDIKHVWQYSYGHGGEYSDTVEAYSLREAESRAMQKHGHTCCQFVRGKLIPGSQRAS